MFGKTMEMRRVGHAIYFMILVCNLAMDITEAKRKIPEMFFHNEGTATTSPKITKKMAEDALIHCTKEMEQKRVFIKDFDMYIPQATDELISALLAKRSINKAIDMLPPQMRNGILDCLRDNPLIVHAYDPEVTSRYLLSHSPGGAFDYSLHVSNKVSSSGKKKKKKMDLTIIIIAMVATAATTFVLIALVFFCCIRTNEKTDEKPLLHLNDYLSESSQKSLSLGSSSTKDLGTRSHKNPSSASSLSTKEDDVSLEIPPGSDTNGAYLKPPPGRAAPPPPAPPPAAPAPKAPPPPAPRAAPPPPPPKGARPPPMPPTSKGGAPGARKTQGSGSGGGDDDAEQKAKLKPFFWDKVTATSDQSMVWHQIRDGSFQFNEEMIETLFGYQAAQNKNNQKKDTAAEPAIQYIQIIDARKAQNLSILLRALNVTTQEVVDALQEGHRLPGELLQTLQKMTPTPDEELKLRLFAGDINQLGPAERFLKTVVEIPFSFKRIDSLLFMSTFPEDVAGLKESLANLEVACNKLQNSRLFLKLLEAVLKTGNRMNDGTYRGGASAFKLDTLLKLSDVKGTDGKTTLLHFVVQEIIRYEGIKCARSRPSSQSESLGNIKEVEFAEDNDQQNEEHYCSLGLDVVSGVSSELEDVKKAAAIDPDVLTSTVTKLDYGLKKTKEFLDADMKGGEEEDTQFYLSMTCFVDAAESDIEWLSEEEKRIMELVKSTADYFHGQAGTKEGLRLFAIVRDFLTMLDKVCKEVRDARAKELQSKAKGKGAPGPASQPPPDVPPPSPNVHKKLFPAISDQRIDDSSSDEDNFSS